MALREALSQVLREPRFLPASGGGGRTCQQVTVISPAPAPCTSPVFHPPSAPPRPVFPGQFSSHSPAFPATLGEHLCKSTGEESAGGRRRECPACPGYGQSLLSQGGNQREATDSQAFRGNSPGCSAPRRGSSGSRDCVSLPAGRRVPGLSALRPRGGGHPRCPRPARPTPPGPGAPNARTHPPCKSRRRRRRPGGRGPAAGAVPTQRRCCPAAELRPVPRPVPAREPPRRQPRRRCSVRRRQRPPSRPPSVPPAGCGGRRDELHQPRLYSGPWAAGRGRECGTSPSCQQLQTSEGDGEEGKEGTGEEGGVDLALHTH